MLKPFLKTVAVALLPTFAVADSDPRDVAVGLGPDALIRHFGLAEADCYALAQPSPFPGLRLELLHVFNPEYEQPGPDGTRYDISIFAGVDDQIIAADGQCSTRDGQISCGVACDAGQFQVLDLDLNSVILHIDALTGGCETSEASFDHDRYGSVFLLDRTDDTTCQDWMLQDRW